MDAIFCDCYEVFSGGALTGIGAVRVDAKLIPSIKTAYYHGLNSIVPLIDKSNSIPKIKNAPILHGSDLLRECDDKTKISAVRALLATFRDSGARFFVVEYHKKSFPELMTSSDTHDGLHLLNILRTVPRGRPFFVVIEQSNARIKDAFPKAIVPEGAYIDKGLSASISYDFQNHLGTYVGQKSEIGLQAADLVSYIWQCKQRPDSLFRKALAALYDEFEQSFEVSEQIWLNSKA